MRKEKNYKYQPTHMKILTVYADASECLSVCSKKENKEGSLRILQCFQESTL